MPISPHTHRFNDDLYSKLEEMAEYPYTVTHLLHEAIADYIQKQADAKLCTEPVKPTRAARKSFTRPDVPALAQYFHERGSTTCNDDANSFFDHFESNGWKVGGRGAMKCWKAAVRNWMKRGKRYENNKPGTPKGQNKRDQANRQRDADRETIQGLAKQPYIESGGLLELHG